MREGGDDAAAGIGGGDGPAAGYVQATVTADTADVAWVIGEPWQGRGYASEAAQAMVGWLGTHGVRTVTAHIHPEHDASAAVADRVGLKPTLTVEDGERLWRMHLDPRLPSPAERRRNLGRLNVLGGLGLIGFALFEIVMARNGALPGGPDQWVRDTILIAAGIALIGAGFLKRRRDRPAEATPVARRRAAPPRRPRGACCTERRWARRTSTGMITAAAPRIPSAV